MVLLIGGRKFKDKIESEYKRLSNATLEIAWPPVLIAFVFGAIIGLSGGLLAHP